MRLWEGKIIIAIWEDETGIHVDLRKTGKLSRDGMLTIILTLADAIKGELKHTGDKLTSRVEAHSP